MSVKKVVLKGKEKKEKKRKKEKKEQKTSSDDEGCLEVEVDYF